MDIQSYLSAYLEQPEVITLLLEYINKKGLDYASLNSDQIIDMLDELSLLQPLYDQISKSNTSEEANSKQSLNEAPSKFSSVPLNRTKNAISFGLKGGRKFKNFKEFENKNDVPHRLSIAVTGFGEKRISNPIPLSSEFTILQNLEFGITAFDLKLQNHTPFELSVSVLNLETGEAQLLAVKLIEWRFLLCYKNNAFDIQLAHYDFETASTNEAVGILSLQLKLKGDVGKSFMSDKAVQNQLELEKKLHSKINTRFYEAASNFWNEYKTVSPTFAQRRIKIYAKSQDNILTPLPKMITPLYNLNGIESPSHALRFCSLLKFQTNSQETFVPSGSFNKRYSSFMASKLGSVEDHCHLLCGILLGFGLKAYVAVGYGIYGEHTWVISIAKETVTFWECTKGQKFDYYSDKTFKYYKSIHALYNHESYFANLQSDDTVISCKFDLSNSNAWKAIDSYLLKELPSYNRQLALSPPHNDSFSTEKFLTLELKKSISSHRKAISRKQKSPNQEPLYDVALESILTIALTNYQTEKATGYSICEDDFKQAIKDYVPTQHCFKAFPMQLNTLVPEQIFEKLKKQKHFADILELKGKDLVFGLKMKLVNMADGVFALWCIFAARYSKLEK